MDTQDRLAGARSASKTRDTDPAIGPDFGTSDSSFFSSLPLSPQSQTRRRLHSALARLSPELRVAIELRTFEGKSFDEVGRALDCSSDAARRTWLRAVYALEVELANLNEESPSGAASDDRPYPAV